MKNIVLISGGFDPIHSGHIALIQEASKYGDVVVLLNSDEWLRQKKGKEFLSFKEREIILSSIKNVIEVIEFDDSDKTCIDGIKKDQAVLTPKGVIGKTIEAGEKASVVQLITDSNYRISVRILPSGATGILRMIKGNTGQIREVQKNVDIGIGIKVLGSV